MKTNVTMPASEPGRCLPERLARACGVLVALVGLVVLAGWTFDVAALKSVLPGFVTMKVNTALCFILGGLALCLLGGREERNHAAARRVGQVCAAAVALVGLVTLGEWVFGWDLPLDDFLFVDPPGAVGTTRPGRMAEQTALSFLLLGTALLLLNTRRGVKAAQGLAALAGLLGVFGFVGYALGIKELVGVRLSTVMALHTAAAIIIFGTGVLLARPVRLRSGVLLLAVLVMFVALIGASGWVYFQHQKAETHRAAEETLAAIADLKVGQIANWMKERRADAEVSRSKVQARQFLTEPANARVREELLHWMTTVHRVYDYRAVMLLDAGGVVRLSVPTDTAPLDADDMANFQTALRTQDVVFADLRADQSKQQTHLSFFIPIGLNPQAEQPANGVLVFVIDPHKFLYPLVQSWPATSRTAETLLVRREGDEVVYLNDLRHRTNTALAMRLPIDQNLQLAAAMAASGNEGLVEGIDYRSIPVFAALRKIPDTPWFIVAKVDQVEIDAPLRHDAWTISLIAGLLLLVATMAGFVLWRQHKLNLTRKALAKQKQGEEILLAEKLFSESLISSLPGVFYLIGREGKFLRWNRRFAEVTGRSADEMAKISPLDLFEGSDKQVIAGAIEKAFTHGEVQAEASFVAKDGTRTPYHFTGAKILVNEAVCLIGLGIDITERKRTEAALQAAQRETTRLLAVAEESRHVLLGVVEDHKEAAEENRRLNAELEQRVHARTAELLVANQELEAFSYSVSHDLRAPLRHLSGFAELLQKNDAAKLDDKARRHLTCISEAAGRMGQLIDDLLAFSRAGRTELRKRPVDLDALVGEVIKEALHDAVGRRVSWQIAPLPHVHADPNLLRAVLTNLLSNALKFTRTRDEAVIEIGATEGDGETVVFIRDNGVGFEMQYVEKLFGVFQRLHAAEQFEGTGIGLANVRRIIARHGGRTWAQSVLNKGATFYFSLPEPTRTGNAETEKV